MDDRSFDKLRLQYARYLGELRKKEPLVEIYKAHAAELPALESRVVELKAATATVAATLRVLRPDWNASHERPLPPRRRMTPFKRGYPRNYAMKMMRQTDDGVTVRQVLESLLKSKGMTDADKATRNAVKTLLGDALRRDLRLGKVTAEGRPMKYRLVRKPAATRAVGSSTSRVDFDV